MKKLYVFFAQSHGVLCYTNLSCTITLKKQNDRIALMLWEVSAACRIMFLIGFSHSQQIIKTRMDDVCATPRCETGSKIKH